MSSVAFYYKSEEGRFIRQDMSRIAEESLRCLGREFHKMSIDEKKSFLSKLEAQREYEKIQSHMNLEEG